MLKNILKVIDKHYDILTVLVLAVSIFLLHSCVKSYLNTPATEENKLYAAKYCSTIQEYYPPLKNNVLTKGDLRLASLRCKTSKENKKVTV